MEYIICKYILPVSRLPFCFVEGFLHCESFLVLCTSTCLFIFCFPCSRDCVQKILLRLISNTLLPTFSSRSFMVSELTFKSLTYFYFIFVYGIREESSFIVFACICPVFPIPLVEETVVSPVYIFTSLVID